MSAEESRPPTGEAGGQASEEELRAAYEAEIKKIRVEQVLLDQVVSLVNLGMRRTGLSAGTEDERDLEQVRLAIETIRAMLPLIERSSPQHIGPIRDALSQLQLAFVRIGGSSGSSTSTAEAGTTEPADRQPEPQGPGQDQPVEGQGPQREGPGPAQRSGRLWVPGQ